MGLRRSGAAACGRATPPTSRSATARSSASGACTTRWRRSGCSTSPAAPRPPRRACARSSTSAPPWSPPRPPTPCAWPRRPHALGIDLPGSAVSRLILSGEPAGSIPQTKALIEEQWGAKAYDTAGMTEIGTIMVFECAHQPGGTHIIEDHVIEEVIDPARSSRSRYGRARRAGGDLVRAGRDSAAALPHRGPRVQGARLDCACGRGFDIYEGGILGRVDDMKIIRGTNVYPRAIEAIVREYSEVDEFQTVITREGVRDEITLRVELKADSATRAGTAVRDAAQAPGPGPRGTELPHRARRRGRAAPLRAQGQAHHRQARRADRGAVMTQRRGTPRSARQRADRGRDAAAGGVRGAQGAVRRGPPAGGPANVRAALALMHNVVNGLALRYEHLSDLDV